MSFRQHFQKVHDITISLRDFKVFSSVFYLAPFNEVNNPIKAIPAIPHLETVLGFTCNELNCRYSIRSQKKIQVHCSTLHKSSNYKAASIQRFFNSNKSSYFEIESNTIQSLLEIESCMDDSMEADINEAMTLWETEQNTALKQSNIINANSTSAITTSWILMTQWDKHFHGIILKDIWSISYLKNIRYLEFYPKELLILQSLDYCFDKVKQSTNGISKTILEWWDSPVGSQPGRVAFASVQEDTTWTRYCRYWKRIMLYLWRLNQPEQPEYSSITMSNLRILVTACVQKDSCLDTALEDWLSEINMDTKGHSSEDIHSKTLALIMSIIKQKYIFIFYLIDTTAEITLLY